MTKQTPAVDWQHLMFNPTDPWLSRLEAIAARRFPRSSMAGSAFNYAFERLSADDWALLGDFDGTARPGTYVSVIFSRLLEDYSRSTFGRCRPPRWLVRLGETWQQVHRMLCMERLETPTIADRFRHRMEDADAWVAETARVIKARIPDCGKRSGEVLMSQMSDGGDALVDTTPDSEPAPEHVLVHDEAEELLDTLRLLLAREPDTDQAAALGVGPSRLRQLRDIALQLTDDEHLVLKLQFQEGMKISQIARALKLPDHTVRRCARRALERLREAAAAVEL